MSIEQTMKNLVEDIKQDVNKESYAMCDRWLELAKEEAAHMTKDEAMRMAWKAAIAWTLPRIRVHSEDK